MEKGQLDQIISKEINSFLLKRFFFTSLVTPIRSPYFDSVLLFTANHRGVEDCIPRNDHSICNRDTGLHYFWKR